MIFLYFYLLDYNQLLQIKVIPQIKKMYEDGVLKDGRQNNQSDSTDNDSEPAD